MGSTPTITHYDFGSLQFSSFYATGLALNAPSHGYRFELSRRPPAFLDGVPMSAGQRDMLSLRLLYTCRSEADDFAFCIDVADDSENFHVPLLDRVRYYFKLNHDLGFVRNDASLARYAQKIVPVLPGFPLKSGTCLPGRPRLLPCRAMAWDLRCTVRRMIDASSLPDVDALRRLRGDVAKDFDVFFVTTYYPEECHRAAMEARFKLMLELERQGLGRSLIGFADRHALPEPFARFAMDRLSLTDYLRALAGARLAIYVRGLLECISLKLGEYLALGVPVIGQRIANNRERLAVLPHFDEQFAYDEPADIAREAAALLKQDDRLRTLGESNARVFDEVLAPEAVVGEVLGVIGWGGPD